MEIQDKGRAPRHLEPVWLLHPLRLAPKAGGRVGEAREATRSRPAWTRGGWGEQELGDSKERQLLNSPSGTGWGLHSHPLLHFIHRTTCICRWRHWAHL